MWKNSFLLFFLFLLSICSSITCPQEGDWAETEAGLNRYMSCGTNKIGAIYRTCLNQGGVAVWSSSSTSNCYPSSIVNSAPSGKVFAVAVLEVTNVTTRFIIQEHETIRRKLVTYTTNTMNIPSDQVYLKNVDSVIKTVGSIQQNYFYMFFYIPMNPDYAKIYLNSILAFFNSMKGSDYEDTFNSILINGKYTASNDMIMILLICGIGYLAYVKVRNMNSRIRFHSDDVYANMINKY
ncbi:hypothetical protein WA158_006063 [Blastocystis sp. Blastoise]